MSGIDNKEPMLKVYDGKVAILKLGNQVLGGGDALAFTSKLHELANDEIKAVVVELSDVEMINSSGLGMLVSGLSTMRKHNILYALSGAPQKVLSLLEMTHLDTIFKIYENEEAAVNDLK